MASLPATPDGSEDRVDFSIPVVPVVAPSPALVSGREFSEWVWQTHGSLGRLLVWDGSRKWWLVNEPDLEVQIVCASVGRFDRHPEPEEPFTWLPSLTDSGRERVAYLTDRYGLKPTA